MRSVRRSQRLVAAAALGFGAVLAGSAPAHALAGGPLPDTGSSVQWWLIGAIAVLILGGGLYAYSRWSSKRGSE